MLAGAPSAEEDENVRRRPFPLRTGRTSVMESNQERSPRGFIVKIYSREKRNAKWDQPDRGRFPLHLPFASRSPLERALLQLQRNRMFRLAARPLIRRALVAPAPAVRCLATAQSPLSSRLRSALFSTALVLGTGAFLVYSHDSRAGIHK